jgi:hypothetical protein
MSESIENAIQSLGTELEAILKRGAEIKKHINDLSVMIGQPAPYTDIETDFVMGIISIQPDQFFGKGVATAVKQFLKMKGRAATIKEIYEALLKGGFEFPVEWKEKEWHKNLGISISKNRYDFVRVPFGNDSAYGLWEFYPEKKKEKDRASQQNDKTEEGNEEKRVPKEIVDAESVSEVQAIAHEKMKKPS